MVTERTHELGVRSALGASPGKLVRLVVGRGVGIACLGVVVGLGASLWVGRLIEHLLFDVSSSDPATLAVVSGLLLAVSLVASYLPARRAGRLDPVGALRDG